MMTQRIANALRQQEWTTILIEFVLVVVGVLIALQLDQWNEVRKDNKRELELLAGVRADIREDLELMRNADAALTLVLKSGATAIAARERGECIDDCWKTLVAYFLASQWIDVALNRSAYDEMRAMGLPRDAMLASALSRYQALGEQGAKVNAELPLYRSLVRSLIPAATQQYMWAHCHSVAGRLQFLLDDCPPPDDRGDFQATVTTLSAGPGLASSLNYWLSTVTLVKSTLAVQVSAGEVAIVDITDLIGDGNK